MRASVLVAIAIVCGARASRADSPIVVPQIAADLQLDGELDEIAWRSPARTGAFTDAHGALAAPYSDARFLRDDRNLYVALYAADEDVEPGDAFVLELSSPRGRLTMHLSAAGAITPAVPGAHAAIDLDGTMRDPTDDDEEWVVEAAVPLAAVPFGPDGTVRVRVSRCDVTKDRVRRCGAWSGRLARR